MLWSDEKSKNQKNLWRSKKVIELYARKLAFSQPKFNAATSLNTKKFIKLKL